MMVVHTLKHLWRMFLPHEISKDLYYVVLFICGTFMNALLTGLWEGQLQLQVQLQVQQIVCVCDEL